MHRRSLRLHIQIWRINVLRLYIRCVQFKEIRQPHALHNVLLAFSPTFQKF